MSEKRREEKCFGVSQESWWLCGDQSGYACKGMRRGSAMA